jgi:hypothetical protein
VAASSGYTYVGWFYVSFFPAVTTYRTFFYRGNDPAVYTQYVGILQRGDNGDAYDGRIEMDISGNPATFGAPLPVGWHFVAYVRSGTTHTLYIDESVATTDTVDVSAETHTHALVGTDTYAIDWDPGRAAYVGEFDFAMSAAQIAVQRLSTTPIVPAYSWATLASDLLDSSGNGRHWSASGGTITFGAQPLITTGPIYCNNFDRGNGSISPPRTANYTSSTWAGGAHTPDTVYPELRESEDVKIEVGTGPSGENVLRSNTGNVTNGAFVVTDIGTAVAPNGTYGWWNATQGTLTAEIWLDSEFYATAIYCPMVAVAGLNKALKLYPALNRVSAGNYNIQLIAEGWGGTRTFYDTGSASVASISVATHSGWHTVRLRWQCGTVNGAFASVSADGWITVDFGLTSLGLSGLTRVLDETAVDLYINDGRQNVQDDRATSSFVGASWANRTRSVAFGFDGLAPTTQICLGDSTSQVGDGGEGGGGGDDPGGVAPIDGVVTGHETSEGDWNDDGEMDMSGILMPWGKQQFHDASGNPVGGGFVYFWKPGTDNETQIVYQNAGLTVAHSQPVTLDAAGRALIYYDPSVGYKVVVQDSAGAQVFAADNHYIPQPTPNICEGRLTLTTATPVTTSDVSAATTLYFAHMTGNLIDLYDGTRWWPVPFDELSITLAGLIASRPYDVFVYNSGTAVAPVPALSLLAWTNATTRATGITRLNGRWVKSGGTTYRYVGTVYINSSGGQTDDTVAKRYVYNEYHQVERAFRVSDTTDSWSYATATIRQANAAAGNKVEVFVGNTGHLIEVQVVATALAGTADYIAKIAIGEDSTTAAVAGSVYGIMKQSSTAVSHVGTMVASYRGYVPLGYHYYAWLESASNTTTFYGDNGTGANAPQSGITGVIRM